MSLEGKTALVSGGGSGVGAVIARRLAAQGARVVICGRRLAPLDAVAQTPGITPEVCDITDEAGMTDMMARHAPQIVVANAGASESAPFVKTDLDAFRRMIDVNLVGTFLTLREGAKVLKGQDWGRMIAVASTAGLKGYAYVAPYAAAKHGVIGMVKSVALELAKTGTTVNALCPGFLDTEMTERSVANIMEKTGRSRDEARAALASASPMQRLVAPGDVAEAALWLCGPGSGMVTGQAISISGGET